MRNPENPAAFPMTGEACFNPKYSQPGMSLRDAFALSIAGGMAAHSGTMGISFGPNEIAIRSYEVADAMLVFRMPSLAEDPIVPCTCPGACLLCDLPF